MRVLIIIPAYNEEASILNTVHRIIQFRSRLSIQLDYLVINDGSTDGTREILETHQLNAIHLIENLGIGGAVQTGYKYAKARDYDVAVQFDGDGQHDIESLPFLLEQLTEHQANMVIGSRFVGQQRSVFQTTFMRRFGITIISKMIALTTGKRILDTTSGYRLVDRQTIAEFAKRYPKKYPEPESTVHLLKRKYRVIEAPANMFERQGGASSITPLKSIRYMIEVCLSILIATFMKEDE